MEDDFICIECNKQLRITAISEVENLCVDCYKSVNCSFDRKRMEIALKSERFKLPKGLQLEEMRDYILRRGQ